MTFNSTLVSIEMIDMKEYIEMIPVKEELQMPIALVRHIVSQDSI